MLTIGPEGPKVQVVAPVGGLDQGRIDRVIRLGRGACNTCRAVVCPGAVLHGRGSGIADGRALRAKDADCVVEVVSAADEVHRWGLIELVSWHCSLKHLFCHLPAEHRSVLVNIPKDHHSQQG